MKSTLEISPGCVGHLATLYEEEPNIHLREISEALQRVNRLGFAAYRLLYLMRLVLKYEMGNN